MSRRRSSDNTAQDAKPPPHGTHPNHKVYEHEQITDNRLVWETLEGENNDA